jgi:hypothetical protein
MIFFLSFDLEIVHHNCLKSSAIGQISGLTLLILYTKNGPFFDEETFWRFQLDIL